MKRPRDVEREARIEQEIIVDAYTPDERAMGWYYYLESQLEYPFITRCVEERIISVLLVGDEVDVVGIAPEEECMCEMFVLMPWERRDLAVPLSQLKVTHGEEETVRAVEDWRYWVERGYAF